MKTENILQKPQVIGVVADINQGKSMLLYHIIETARKNFNFNLFYYKLKVEVSNSQEVFTVAEIENITNSVIVIDELSSLFDLDNRKEKKTIEKTFRLLNHNNNIVILCGTPENFKKFISAKVNLLFFKKSTIADYINGSRIRNIITSFKGDQMGSEILQIPIDKALFYDGSHFKMIDVPYYVKYDTKKKNVPICVPHNVK